MKPAELLRECPYVVAAPPIGRNTVNRQDVEEAYEAGAEWFAARGVVTVEEAEDTLLNLVHEDADIHKLFKAKLRALQPDGPMTCQSKDWHHSTIAPHFGIDHRECPVGAPSPEPETRTKDGILYPERLVPDPQDFKTEATYHRALDEHYGPSSPDPDACKNCHGVGTIPAFAHGELWNEPCERCGGTKDEPQND